MAAKKNTGTVKWNPVGLAGIVGNLALGSANKIKVPGTTAGPGAAPAAAPAAAPVPTMNPLLEGQYLTSTGNADTAYGNSLAGFTNDENAAGADYGFSVVRNPDGTVNTGATEAGVQGADVNPFSKMNLLTRAYQQQMTGTTNNYAAQGQAFSSAAQDEQGFNKFNYNQGQDALYKAFESILRGDNQGRLTAGDTRNSAYDTAAGTRIQGYLNG